MKFHTFGSDDGKTILLIHGMLNPWQIWKDVSDAFADCPWEEEYQQHWLECPK